MIPYDLVRKVAAAHGLDPALVLAVILTESGGDPHAYRFEHELYLRETAKPKYTSAERRPRNESKASERAAQCSSWGPMQVLGLTARDMGFSPDRYLTELSSWEIGVEWGCRYLAKQLNRYQGDVDDALAAYNAGSARRGADGKYINQHYVDVTRKHMAEMAKEMR